MTLKAAHKIDISNLYQVEEDWKKPFITDIKVINKNLECSDITQETPGEIWLDLFDYTWSGMRTVFSIDCNRNYFNTDSKDCKENKFKVEILANQCNSLGEKKCPLDLGDVQKGRILPGFPLV